VDETYISIKAKWHYLYRAVDKHGKTVDFLLRRDRCRPHLFDRNSGCPRKADVAS
jgi:putative transposase